MLPLLCSLYASLLMFVSFSNIHHLSHAYCFHMLTIFTCYSISHANHYHMPTYSHVFYFLLHILYFTMYKRPPNTVLDSSLVLTVNLSHLRLRSLEDLSEDLSFTHSSLTAGTPLRNLWWLTSLTC
jgi:hypothetical protein